MNASAGAAFVLCVILCWLPTAHNAMHAEINTHKCLQIPNEQMPSMRREKQEVANCMRLKGFRKSLVLSNETVRAALDCITQGKDNTECCVANHLPTKCLSLCNGTAPEKIDAMRLLQEGCFEGSNETTMSNCHLVRRRGCVESEEREKKFNVDDGRRLIRHSRSAQQPSASDTAHSCLKIPANLTKVTDEEMSDVAKCMAEKGVDKPPYDLSSDTAAGAFFECFSLGKDNTECCAANGIPPASHFYRGCFPLCNGTPPMRVDSKQLTKDKCSGLDVNKLLSCHLVNRRGCGAKGEKVKAFAFHRSDCPSYARQQLFHG